MFSGLRRRVQWYRCGVHVDNVSAYLDSFAVIFVCLSPDPQLWISHKATLNSCTHPGTDSAMNSGRGREQLTWTLWAFPAMDKQKGISLSVPSMSAVLLFKPHMSHIRSTFTHIFHKNCFVCGVCVCVCVCVCVYKLECCCDKVVKTREVVGLNLWRADLQTVILSHWPRYSILSYWLSLG